MQNIILNMTSRRTNTPVYSQNNLSNQRLEAHASVDWITFIDPCSGGSCQVIIPEKCSGVQNQYLVMPASNKCIPLDIYYVQPYTTNYSNYRPLRKSLLIKRSNDLFHHLWYTIFIPVDYILSSKCRKMKETRILYYVVGHEISTQKVFVVWKSSWKLRCGCSFHFYERCLF